ncbi:MAG: hypothetical protein WBF42_09705, partial [Terracidiphilus sp.]
YWHLPVNDDATSLLHNTLDPDLPTEAIYESDIDPARSAGGLDLGGGDPCLFFDYSPRTGIQRMPGQVIRSCGDIQDPEEKEGVERFEVDLHYSLLIDKRTDLYLADTIPIAFQRVTRDGWKGVNAFGISGSDNYDAYLSSADNIRIDVVRADGGREQLLREPRNLPVLSLVTYVDPGNRGLYEMKWRQLPFEHYEVRRFDGAVSTFLPCNSSAVWCYLTGYRSPQGEELKFERGTARRLMSLTSPHQHSVHLSYDERGRIAAATDSNGRIVRYGYDAGNRLVTVTYPSGEVCHYDYDDAQHLLAFSVSPDGKTSPQVLMRNEYLNGVLTRQTLADGSVYEYSYTYDPANRQQMIGATVHTPDGRSFDVNMKDWASVVHER